MDRKKSWDMDSWPLQLLHRGKMVEQSYQKMVLMEWVELERKKLVMTDAALLKRQKKEIEELRSKLQGSHSEHLEEEILNLRNTLLQGELERKRIDLELQERERRLQEQAQRIENLSTMVLYSAMDDREKCVKTKIRRETWCPSAPLKEFTEDKLAASKVDLFVADEEREALAYELEVTLEKLKLTPLELNSLQEKHASLTEQFREDEAICKQLEDSVSVILEEKEEMAMQLVDTSLQLEEKAVFSAREKSVAEAVKEEGRRKLSMLESEVNLLKEHLQKLKVELESSQQQCKQLTEQQKLSVAEGVMREQNSASCLDLAKVREDLNRSKAEYVISQDAMRTITETLESRAKLLSLENEKISRDMKALQNELDKVKDERDEHVGAEKLAALIQQTLLEGKYNEIYCKFISTTETVEALTERIMILEEQVQNGELI